jgi:hypothetical protein
MGCLALSKNRSFGGWFLLSFFFSPIIAILALIVVPVLPAPYDDVLNLHRPRRLPGSSMPLPVKLLMAVVLLVIALSPLLMPGLFVSSPPAPITQASEPKAAAMPAEYRSQPNELTKNIPKPRS